jgi:DNA-binding response OmpR family regulator
MKAIAERSVQSGDPAVRHFETAVDLIRHMLHREAIDLVVVDADTHLDAVARLSAWKASQGREDFSILVVGQLLRPELMARALELGGDDIVEGAFDIDEFAVRAARCLERLNASVAHAFRFELAGYILDKHTQRVTLDGVTLPLSAHEFELAWLFFSSPGVLISRPRITAEVWRTSAADIGSALGKQMHRLRAKLRIEKGGTVALRAVYSSGYRLDVADDNRSDGFGPEQTGLLLDAPLSQDAQSAFTGMKNRRVSLIAFRAAREPHFMTRSLEASADEIVQLPLKAGELYLPALKRFSAEASEHRDHEVAFANYRLGRRGERVTLCDNSTDMAVRLTSREFAILWALSIAPGHYLSRQQIASAIWASNEDLVGRTLEQHIYKIRKKMKMTGESGARIRTIYARGYRLECLRRPKIELLIGFVRKGEALPAADATMHF